MNDEMGRAPSPLQGHLAWLLSLACHLAGVGLLYLLASYSEPVLPPPQAPGPLLQARLLSGLPGQRAQPSIPQPHTAAPASLPVPPAPAVQAHPGLPAITKPPTPKPRVSHPPLPARQPQPAPSIARLPEHAPAPPPAPEPKPEATPMPAAAPSAQTAAQAAGTHVQAAIPVSGATATQSPAGSASDEPPLITHARYRGKPRPVEYPPQARQRGWQGTVVVEVWLDGEGKQLRREIIQSSGRSLLDRAALRSVARSDFYPHMENGRGRPSRLRLPVIFKLTTP